MKTYAAVAALMLAAATPALAQAPAPAAPRPAPGPAAPMAPMGTETFRQMAMMSDMFEIQSSRLALERSRNPAVRRFASVMVRDHQRTSAALMGGPAGAPPGGPVGAAVAAPFAVAGAAAGGMGMGGLDARHAAMLSQLQAAQGRQFDALYAQMQAQAHQEAVGLFTAYVRSGTDPGMRAFAQSVLPSLQHHLGMARRLSGVRGARMAM